MSLSHAAAVLVVALSAVLVQASATDSPASRAASTAPRVTSSTVPPAAVGGAANKPGSAVAPLKPLGAQGEWGQVFGDEFSGKEVDPSKWATLRGGRMYPYGYPFSVANIDSGFSAGHTTVSDGALRIRWDNTPITIGSYVFPYTTGIAQTAQRFSFTYGFAEAKVRFTSQPGLWPAFWLLPEPVDTVWPPEVDISEWVADSRGRYRPFFNTHWRGAAGPEQMGWKDYGVPGQDYADSWHTYGLRWEPGFLEVYLDGVPMRSFTSANVPDRPMYLVLNGGVRKGATPGNGELLVDYVRVWQKPAAQQGGKGAKIASPV